jgi:hypothetical protein
MICALGLLLLLPTATAFGEEQVRSGPGLRLPVADVPARLTGKERLGEKWKDEQRLDNCNVPLDKRGPTPRPDACANVTSK